MNEIEIFKGIETINGFPAIFIKNLNSIAIADLHLGYELALAEQGVFVPQTQLKEIIEDLEKIFRIKKAKSLIIVGDVKHEFGEASKQELKEVKELVNFLRKKVEKIILIRGNHDNFLLTICSHLGIELYDPFYLERKICFIHGHKKIDLPFRKFDTLIIAHEHPSLLLSSGFDRIKVPCLLYGKYKKKNFICLPAISPWAKGVVVNKCSKDELLSPILREGDFENLVPIAIDKEAGALKFPRIGDLRDF